VPLLRACGAGLLLLPAEQARFLSRLHALEFDRRRAGRNAQLLDERDELVDERCHIWASAGHSGFVGDFHVERRLFRRFGLRKRVENGIE